MQLDSLKKQDIIERLQVIATDSLLGKNEKNTLLKLDVPYTFEDIKKMIKELFIKENKLYFIIGNNININGKVITKLSEYVHKIPVIKIVQERIGKGEDEEFVYTLKFFNDKIDKRHKIIATYDLDFYLYKLISNEKEYLILSLDQLSLEEYYIEGMSIEINDFAEIGNYSKLSLKLPLIIVNRFSTRILKFKDHHEFFSHLPLFSEDQLMSYIFSYSNGFSFRHPELFEKLIASFLFSAPYDSSPYPLHLLIVGTAGSGKSKVMECLHWKFKENNEITDGSCSTMKSLIPSFKSLNIQTGDLIKSNRLCCIDEFLRILVRIPPEEREPQLAALNPLLEHKTRNFGSGNYSFKGKMSAKMIAVSNPVYGTSDMIRLARKIDKSFLSRVLIYYQDKAHFNYIANKEEKDLEKCKLVVDNEFFLSLYDYMNSFKSELDFEKLNKIFNEGLDLLGEDKEENEYHEVRNIYVARYKHHLYCIADGIVKLRVLTERYKEDNKQAREINNIINNNLIIEFKFKEEDLLIVKSIWLFLISNLKSVKVWGGN